MNGPGFTITFKKETGEEMINQNKLTELAKLQNRTKFHKFLFENISHSILLENKLGKIDLLEKLDPFRVDFDKYLTLSFHQYQKLVELYILSYVRLRLNFSIGVAVMLMEIYEIDNNANEFEIQFFHVNKRLVEAYKSINEFLDSYENLLNSFVIYGKTAKEFGLKNYEVSLGDELMLNQKTRLCQSGSIEMDLKWIKSELKGLSEKIRSEARRIEEIDSYFKNFKERQ